MRYAEKGIRVVFPAERELYLAHDQARITQPYYKSHIPQKLTIPRNYDIPFDGYN